MENKFNIVRQHSGLWRSLRDGDFEEEEVWSVIKDRPDYKSKDNEYSPFSVPRTLPTASRMIPRTNSKNNSSAGSSHENKVVQQSAPVNIPDWPKIYRNNKQNKTAKNVSRFDHDYDFYHSFGADADADADSDGFDNYGGEDSDDEEEELQDEFDPKLPPHEFIARRLARSQISSFSVFEGVGRTLKGRDLSKVRNAVLSKTGFLESL
ncbi:putative senescence regulator S40 [Lupinus albus]|uniref:Putative senescence regulator S40 n=1 Tax=Lupinus albus TaxID=3870 RepID=A0A6A4P8U7_LUPAL|nr:putative senescence regulator S40 [Lupinus albus]